MHLRPATRLAIVLLLLPGCLPYSCSRSESRALFPSDSLSRALAEGTAIDTLETLAPVSGDFGHPRTLAFNVAGVLYAADTERNVLHRVERDGSASERNLDTLKYPYLAGFRGGLPVVYSPDLHRVVSIDMDLGGVWSLPLPSDGPERGSLTYVAATDSAVWFKIIADGFDGYVARLDSNGQEVARIGLPGPHWRYAGLLRSWGPGEVSLSGYRPVVYTLYGDRLDSLALIGFDSPMLPRSRQFMIGKTESPPLLTASAAAADSLLFALNMRPGWLQVDIYGPDARLRRVLVEPSPAFDKNYFPTDIAVWPVPGGGYEIAVTVTEPEAGIRRYRWSGFGN